MSSQGTWIAVVDDDVSTRQALARVLTANGWLPVVFATGAELFVVLKVTRPACVILDVCLPPPNGLEVEVMLHERAPSVPVIFVTAHEDPAVEAHARACPRSMFLRKPVSEAQLMAAIAATVAASRPSNGSTPHETGGPLPAGLQPSLHRFGLP
jgi:FixJ family two-component response regulator